MARVLTRDMRELGIGKTYRDRVGEIGAAIEAEREIAEPPCRVYRYTRPSNGEAVWAVEYEFRADADVWMVATVVLDAEPDADQIARACAPGAVAGVDLNAMAGPGG